MSLKPFYRWTPYYETDKMGIVHHSNYLKWLEDARIDFLEQMGFPYDKMEEKGIMIPVLSASCKYKYAVRFNETVCIKLYLEEFTGLKFRISYKVTDKETGEIRLTAETSHFFVDGNFKPIRIKNTDIDIYNMFKNAVGVDLYN